MLGLFNFDDLRLSSGRQSRIARLLIGNDGAGRHRWRGESSAEGKPADGPQPPVNQYPHDSYVVPSAAPGPSGRC